MMRVPFFQIDAFAERPFQGNPAAVCLLDNVLDDSGWAQSLAAEMNLSETAFVEPADAEGLRRLRWFTPAVEVDLCGHATLAAAHAVWQSEETARGPLRFSTRSGVLTAGPKDDAGQTLIELDFPARPPQACTPPEGVLEALGVMPRWFGRSAEGDYLVEVESVEFVTGLNPDFVLLKSVEARGVMVTAAVCDSDAVEPNRRGQRPDFVSRFFAPAVGVDEDPVTGSAHCTLAPYWAQRLKRSDLLGYQASQRGGFVGLEVSEDRVALSGSAVTVVEGWVLR